MMFICILAGKDIFTIVSIIDNEVIIPVPFSIFSALIIRKPLSTALN